MGRWSTRGNNFPSPCRFPKRSLPRDSRPSASGRSISPPSAPWIPIPHTWRCLAARAARWGRAATWPAISSIGGEVAGRCVIRHLDVDGIDEVELGYGFHTKYWGQGLATEIATELLRLGRHELGLPTLVAITTAANLGSQRVLIKIGLVYERDVDHEGVPHQLYRSTAQ